MKALVVGGTGFIGGAVAASLERGGFEVVCLSRRGGASASRSLRGDVRAPNLGLPAAEAAELQLTVTHIVSCFGSVAWDAGPRLAHDMHLKGTRNALEFAQRCRNLARFAHVSSVLALGNAEGRIDRGQLDLGQRFRSWYEYGKFLAERAVREPWPFERRVIRLGPAIGVGAGDNPTALDGVLAAVPFLLRGYPIHLERRGDFPSYVCDGMTAGEVIARATARDEGPQVWTWFDHRMYSVAQVLAAVCSAWGVVPRVVSMPLLGRVAWLAPMRLGIPEPLLHYTKPWVDIPATVLDDLPPALPRCPDGYLEATGAQLRSRATEAMIA